MFRILITGGSGFIGTHLIDSFLSKGLEFRSIDIARPKKPEHSQYWLNCNILDSGLLGEIFADFKPTYFIHLAARATTEGKTLDDFRDNTEGTANVLAVLKNTASVSRVIITSSQHVRKPGSGIPNHDEDFLPHGLYGQSKVITERLTRAAELTCTWTIIRPTTVWGPYHPFLPGGLWRLIKKGLYFHPRNDLVWRSYAYVKNVTWQIEQILNASASKVNGKVFYTGEEPIKQLEWINSFSRAITGHKILEIPITWIYLLALFGEVLHLFGKRFPMDKARFFNLTTTNPVPVQPLVDVIGIPPFTLEDGVKETVDWLNSYGYC